MPQRHRDDQPRLSPWRTPLVALALALAALTAGPVAAQDVLPDRRIVTESGMDLPGGDISPLFEVSHQACVEQCLADRTCTALTYNSRARACFPKSAPGAPVPFDGAVSGRVIDTDPATQTRAAARAEAARDWLTPDDLRAARRQAVDLDTDYPQLGEDLDTMRALAATDSAPADRRAAAIVALTDSAADWMAFSDALMAEAGRSTDSRPLETAAQNAALNAWLRDPGPAVGALIRWAQLAEKQDRGRAGLSALRYAAQNGGAGDAALADQIAGFQERHGFRVTDNRVDNDSPDPRACAIFSDDLSASADYRPFVALPDPAMAVEADGQQLCITGLTRGSELKLTLRAGLPSAGAEVLARPVELAMYVRDRAPLARFGGRAYVLPAGGDQGLTLRTVNTGSVDLVLYRMSDRNIVRALRDDIFAAQLDDWKADNFTAQMGEEIWHGTADVAPPAGGGTHPVNAEVATRLDLRNAAGPLTPGIYALTAAVPGENADRSPPATQWFMISDLGIASYAGTDGLTVAVRGLSDAAAREGVEIALVSRGNAILGLARTDPQGIARFDAGLTRGTGAAEPAVLSATTRDGETVTDLSFLSLLDPEFDLSDRGVEGQPPAPPIDVFVATDRGAYRAGEVAHATILTRDDRARAIDGLPLTAVVLRPDGVEHARIMPAPAGDGGYTLDVPIPETAPRGLWRVDLRVEQDGPALASANLLVEDFRPERIAFDLSLPDGPQSPTQPVAADIDARWLFGAPAADLPVEGALRLTPARAVPGWDGYLFGRADDDAQPQIVEMPSGQTDDQGRFAASIDLPPAMAQATRPYDARLTLTVREGAGRPVERQATRLVLPARTALGIKPGFEGGTVPEGSDAAFQIVALGPDLQPQAGQASWQLNEVQTDYQWYAIGGDWTWEPITRRSRVAGGDLTLASGQPTPLAVPVGWGRFELVVTAPDGAVSSTQFDAGWGAVSAGTDTPDRLRVTLDRPAYRIGDTAKVTLDAAADGVAVVSVLSNRVIAMQAVPVTAGTNSVDLPVTEDWGANAYVAVSAIRPLAPGAGEAPAQGSSRAPIRALGIAPATIDPGDRQLAVTLTAPPEVDPRGQAEVTLAVAGAAAGETVHATVWAVDQGILNLTGYQPPSATKHYFGQRRLGVALRDLYGRLILPGGAADGAIRSGGDAASMQTQAPPPTEKLMAWFSGPVTVDANGQAKVSIPLPDFNGELRVMAVAWTAKAVGQADTTMLVRDPVVMVATVPAFLSPGDRADAQVALTHVTGPAGEVALSVESLPLPDAAPAEMGAAEPGPSVQLTTQGLPPTVTLAEKGAATLPLTLIAPDTEGTALVRLSARLPDGRMVTKDLTIPVLRQDAAVNRRMQITLAPGASQTVDLSPLGAFRPGTGRITLTSGAFARLDVPGALALLAAYPYGCTEQLASGALPQIYARGLMPEGMPTPPGVEPKSVDNAIAQILTRQTSGGSFGLWRPDIGDRWLDAYVTDFLSRARSAGYAVPDQAYKAALMALQNELNVAADPQFADAGENAATAYAAYVLARDHAAVISDLRYYVDTAAESFATPLAAAQLGAALASYGDQARADVMFRRAGVMAAGGIQPSEGFRADYGTVIRDRAAVLALAAEAGSQVVDRDGLARAIATQIDARALEGAQLSTQEAGWIVLAAQALTSNAGANGLTLSGAALSAPVQDLGDAAALPPVVLENTGPAPIDVTLGATAVPVDAPAAGGTAFSISRSYFTPDGTPADPANVPLGTRLIAVVEVNPLTDADGRLIIADPLPAGFEIDNPNLLGQGEIEGLDWLGGTTETDMAEFRQDRFAAAVTLHGRDPVRLAYRLRAVTPGQFHHPAATVEDMYRPDRRAWTDSGTTVIQ